MTNQADQRMVSDKRRVATRGVETSGGRRLAGAWPRWPGVVILTAMVCGGCGTVGDALLHQTASFGSDTAGQRGTAQVVFINNTPYRAIFTFGAYDDYDQDTEPQLESFSPNAASSLEGEFVSAVRTITCARVFSVGGDAMNRLARENLPDDQLVLEALVPGVYFSSAEVGDENEALPTEGTAAPLDLWLGVDFACGSLVVFRFEVDDVGPDPFRVDFEVIPSKDTR